MDNCYLEAGLLSVVHAGDNLLGKNTKFNVIIQGNIALFVEAIQSNEP